MKESHQSLWDKIINFELDHSGASMTFTDRLARENDWTLEQVFPCTGVARPRQVNLDTHRPPRRASKGPDQADHSRCGTGGVVRVTVDAGQCGAMDEERLVAT